MKKTSNAACLVSQVVALVSARQLIFPFVLLLIFTFNQNTLCAQMDVYQVNNSISTRFVSIRAAGSNNFIAIGETRSSDTLVNRALLVKLDLNYNVVWTRRSIAINTVDVELKDCYYEDGGTTIPDDDSYIVIGNVLSTPNKGFFWRVAASTGATIGNIMYYEHSSTTRLSYLNKLPNVGGGARYLITGRTQLTGGSSNLIAICVNNTGAIQWQSTVDYPSATNPNADGRNNWGSDAVVSTDQNHLYVSGAANWLESIPPGSPNTYLVGEPYLLELSLTDGSIIKSRRYGPSQQGTYYDTYELLEAQDGSLIMVGRMSDGSFSDIRINKIDAISPAFDPVWANAYNFKVTDDGYAASLSDDLVFITGVHNTSMPGNINNDIMGLTIDMNGDINASKSLNYGTTTGNDKTGLNGGDVVNGTRLIAGSSTSFSNLFNNTNEAGLIIRHNLAQSGQPRQNICNELPATYNKGSQLYSQSLQLRNVTSPVSSSSTPLLNAKGAITNKQTPNNCCATQAGAILLNGSTGGTNLSTFTQFTATGTSYTGLTIQVDRGIIIDGNYTFTNCIFKMNPGSEIIVRLGNTLTLNSCTYSGQCELWKGITVENNGRLVTTGTSTQNTIIRDAQYAVRALSGSNLNIQNTTFRNNFIGIYVPIGANNMISWVCNNNRFDGTGSILPYSNWTPIVTPIVSQLSTGFGTTNLAVGTVPFAGIYAANIINNLTFNTCAFASLQQGVVLDRCGTVTTNGCTFTGIATLGYTVGNSQSTNGASNWAGAGITQIGYAKSRLAVIGLGNIPTATTTFNNVTTGVYASGGIADILNNRFENVNTGIYGESTNGSYLSNRIWAKNYGIYVLYNGYANGLGLYIEQNNITLAHPNLAGSTPSFVPTGIYSASPSSSVINGWSIRDNTILMQHNAANTTTVFGSRRGIHVLNATDSDVLRNIIELNTNLNTITCEGIRLEGSNKLKADCNTVSVGTYTPNTLLPTANQPQNNNHIAINIANVLNSSISNNITDATRTGIFVNGVCTATKLQKNTIERHLNGYWAGASANYGNPQLFKGNIWRKIGHPTGDYNDWGVAVGSWSLARTNVTSAFFVSNSGFTVKPMVAGTVIPPNKTLDPSTEANGVVQVAGTIADFIRTNSTAGCHFGASCGNEDNYTCGAATLALELSPAESAFAAGNYDFTDYPVEQNYSADKDLYAKLNEAPNLVASSSVYQDFIDTKASESEGQLYEVKEMTETALTPDESLALQIETLKNTITYLSEDLEQLNSSLGQIGNDDNATLLAMANVKAQLEALNTNLDNLIQIANTTRLADLDLAKINNLGINDARLPAYYQKIVNDISLRTVDRDMALVEEEDLANLEMIANQCPLRGGQAVYAARALFAKYANPYYDDDVLCIQQGLLWKNETIMTETGLNVYPNPAKDNVSLNFPEQEQDTDLLVYSIDGVLIERLSLPAHSQQLDYSVGHLSNGIYVLKSVIHEGLVKLIIMH